MSPFLYCDGGVILKNPSQLGGTWAFCCVSDKGIRTFSKSGVVLPSEQLPSITNNYTELYAAVMALEYVGPGWDGIIHTDSKITLHRITDSYSFNGIPNDLRQRCLSVRRCRKYKVVLLGGHPTRKELAVGRDYRGYPTSRHNVYCDKRCKFRAKQLVERMSK